ncbi:PaaI family thioesterase [Amylibacter sp. IMCC11727]|uniref:PaaI family thioesterase n=1 Tax=Amylibacter sp. IMCC11727 TaxID=3039851 RepID=UPI00244DE8DA|nr:PaaI family thioesterase [Amylibacter sp. IMCC11727]WGI20495.1 PaaI family thioesterase [Amylibacter sp. IMCC11727]
MALKMTIKDLDVFLKDVFPQVCDDFAIEELSEDEITVRLKVSEKHLRPGGTVSGPSMFGLADVCFYLIILANVGPKALTVTTNCSIDFMRKPAPKDLIAKARLLKLGKALAVGDVLLFSEGMEKPVAHANVTYSIPPKD